MRLSGIPGDNRTDQCLVLCMGMEQPARRAELDPSVGTAPIADGSGHVRQDAVMSAAADHGVQLLIGDLEVFDELAARYLTHALVEALQVSAFGRNHAHRRQTGAGGFQFHHGDEHLVQLAGRQFGDEGAPIGAQFDQTGARQLTQRLADGRARNLEAIGENLLLKPFARPKVPEEH